MPVGREAHRAPIARTVSIHHEDYILDIRKYQRILKNLLAITAGRNTDLDS